MRKRRFVLAAVAAGVASFGGEASADQGGKSFWLPGFYGSFAAVPAQPGFSLATIYYHTSVSAGGDVASSTALTIRNRAVPLTVNLNAEVKGKADIAVIAPTYTFAEPVAGGRFTVGMLASYGRASTNIDANVIGALGPIGFAAQRSI